MIICTLRTDVIEWRVPNTPTEGGVFEVVVSIDRKVLRKQPSPRAYVNKEIALHLRQAIVDTTVPREFWYATFTPQAQAEFNFPEAVRLG